MTERCPHCNQVWTRWVDRQAAWRLIKPFHTPGAKGKKNAPPQLNGRTIWRDSDRKFIEELRERYGQTHLGHIQDLLEWAGLQRLEPRLLALVK